MLRSCKYCGRVHEDTRPCEQKKAAQEKRVRLISAREYRRDKASYRFRSSPDWTKRSVQIRERDHYLCLCCAAGLKGTIKRYNQEDLEVHHIIPIKEDETLRLEETNLITVCKYHHYLCEIGTISRQQQMQLVEESIKKAQALGVQGF